MNDSQSNSGSEREKVELCIQLDPELVEQINHLTNNPSKTIEVAVRQWPEGREQSG